jgi:hypothetical protein
MRLNLRYEPTPENASRFAADIVKAAQNVSGVALDYSADSLKHVDDIIEGMRSEGCSADQVAETLFGFGCYVGEVLVRQAGATWQQSADTPMANFAGFPLVLHLRGQSYCNPIAKAFKRLDNGPEDSLPYFYAVFTKDLGQLPPPARKPWWKFWGR